MLTVEQVKANLPNVRSTYQGKLDSAMDDLLAKINDSNASTAERQSAHHRVDVVRDELRKFNERAASVDSLLSSEDHDTFLNGEIQQADAL